MLFFITFFRFLFIFNSPSQTINPKPCRSGTYADVVGGSTCKDCAIDSFNADEGRVTSCDKCADDATTNSTGNIVCSKCNAGLHMKTDLSDKSKTCSECPSGFVAIYGKEECTQCLAGTFTDTDQTSCISCEVGLYSSALGAATDSVCTKCLPGRYSSAKGVTSADGCTRCAAGKKNPSSGSNSSGACTDCDAMSKSEAGRSSCDNCAVGEKSEAGSAKW